MTQLRRNDGVVRLPIYEIWIAGEARINGCWRPVRLHTLGTYPGRNFSEACLAWAKTTDDPEQFNFERLTWCGCPLYPSREQAVLGANGLVA